MFEGLTVYFIRHGETDWNLERRLQGSEDTSLNETGRAQARRHARVLAELGHDWSGFEFHSSPLRRTAETMDIIRREIGAATPEPRVDRRIREGAFGRWEGRTWQEILRDDPDGHAAFLERGWTHAPHGGECYADIAVRLRDWAGGLTRDAVVVSHGGVSRVLRGLYLGLDPAETLSLSTPQKTFFRLRDGTVERL